VVRVIIELIDGAGYQDVAPFILSDGLSSWITPQRPGSQAGIAAKSPMSFLGPEDIDLK